MATGASGRPFRRVCGRSLRYRPAADRSKASDRCGFDSVLREVRLEVAFVEANVSTDADECDAASGDEATRRRTMRSPTPR